MEKLGYYETVVYSQVVIFVVLVALIPVLDPHLVVSLAALAALAVAGGLNFVAFIFLYRAFHRGVVSMVAPLPIPIRLSPPSCR